MNDLTAVIIAKNEEETIEECLKSLSFVDTILLLDCYSTDKTVEIVTKYKAKVVKVRFSNFSQIRNESLKYVKTKWVIYIDADERVTEGLSQSILNAINTDFGAVSFSRQNYYLGKKWPKKEQVIRLFQKDKLIRWFGEIHESPEYKGECISIKGDLLHFTHRTIESMFLKTMQWSNIEAKIRHETSHPKITSVRLIRVYLTGFYNSYLKGQGFRVGSVGLIEGLYQGLSMFITYIKLWEMQKKSQR